MWRRHIMNDLVKHEPELLDDDDGFGGSLTGGRLVKGSLLRWKDTDGWFDRDGITPPSPLLVVAITDALQRWKDKKPEVITDKPLPDPDGLNAAIPGSEWETD